MGNVACPKTELEFRTLRKSSPEPELQPTMHRCPAWPFALHSLGPPTDPEAEHPSVEAEKRSGEKGEGWSLWTDGQRRTGFHETLPRPCVIQEAIWK